MLYRALFIHHRGLYRLCAALLVAALASVLLSFPAQAAPPEAPSLFSEKSNEKLQAENLRHLPKKFFKNERPVDIHFSALRSAGEFSVQLGNTSLRARRASETKGILAERSGFFTDVSKGSLRNAKGNLAGHFTLTRSIAPDGSEGVYGIFKKKNGQGYILQYDIDGYKLQEIDFAQEPPCPANHSINPHPSELSASDAVFPGDIQASASTTVDVLVAYSAAARSAQGGTASMLALINTAISESNSAYENSGVNLTLRLVHTMEVSEAESGNFSTELSRLRIDGDGFYDSVHDARDLYGADVVVLIQNSGNACGIGYLLSLSSPNAGYGFSVTARNCATGYYSFSHEIGHNMGLHHDPANAGAGAAYSYSYGHRFGPTGNEYRTIMAYAPGTRVRHFSNPQVNYSGYATGVHNAADNTRTLNQTGKLVAAYRQASSGGGGGGGSGGIGGGGGFPSPTPTLGPTPRPTPTPGSGGGGSGGGGGGNTVAYTLKLSLVGNVPHAILRDAEGLPIDNALVQIFKRVIRTNKRTGRVRRILRFRTLDFTNEFGQIQFSTIRGKGVFVVEHEGYLSNRIRKTTRSIKRKRK